MNTKTVTLPVYSPPDYAPEGWAVRALAVGEYLVHACHNEQDCFERTWALSHVGGAEIMIGASPLQLARIAKRLPRLGALNFRRRENGPPMAALTHSQQRDLARALVHASRGADVLYTLRHIYVDGATLLREIA